MNIIQLYDESGNPASPVTSPETIADADGKSWQDLLDEKADDDEVVKTVAQTLTSTDQAQARTNIDVYSKAEVDARGSSDWKLVFNGVMAAGERIKEFTTFADGTPLNGKEAIIQFVHTIKSANDVTGYVCIRSSSNDVLAAFGSMIFNSSSSVLPNAKVANTMRVYTSPLFYSYAEIESSVVTINIASKTNLQRSYGASASHKDLSIHNNITYLKLDANSALLNDTQIKVLVR